ncbi:hypothetical protein BV509_01005 [Rhodovulum sulfidophilum]|nr:hypothetical protein BV509_01005 [Rhodovulum sulfidophilum]
MNRLYATGTRLRELSDLIRQGERDARIVAAFLANTPETRADVARRFRQVAAWAEEAAKAAELPNQE